MHIRFIFLINFKSYVIINRSIIPDARCKSITRKNTELLQHNKLTHSMQNNLSFENDCIQTVKEFSNIWGTKRRIVKGHYTESDKFSSQLQNLLL
jgi:hypothetical protein